LISARQILKAVSVVGREEVMIGSHTSFSNKYAASTHKFVITINPYIKILPGLVPSQ